MSDGGRRRRHDHIHRPPPGPRGARAIEEERPFAAFGVSLAAGVLMLVEGLLLAVVAGVASSIGASAASGLLGGLAVLGVLFGLLVIVFAVLLLTSPEHHTSYGIVIIVLSLVSFFGGGGFYLGILLGVIGGILAIRFEESEDLEFDWEYNRPRVHPSAGIPSSRPAATPGICANCRSTVPPGADRCPNCEAPVRPTSYVRSLATGQFGAAEPSPAQPPASPPDD